MSAAGGAKPWRRWRFKTSADDVRPVAFPPPGPWWCSGEGEGYSIIVAFLPRNASLFDWWPEATEAGYTNESDLWFTDRFPEPDWWKRVSR